MIFSLYVKLNPGVYICADFIIDKKNIFVDFIETCIKIAIKCIIILFFFYCHGNLHMEISTHLSISLLLDVGFKV